tara:strand:- start:147 stop:566 length:420 start_codon:yes stop_codon:yes gene_type:complete
MNSKKLWQINKIVLPQDSDHAGVMWHGTYFNWLEEARVSALSKSGLNYIDLIKNGFELPLIDASIKYLSPLFLGDNITIQSQFKISKSPKIIIHSQFINKRKKVLTIAEVHLVLINKQKFSIIRKRPDFISKAFLKLNG